MVVTRAQGAAWRTRSRGGRQWSRRIALISFDLATFEMRPDGYARPLLRTGAGRGGL